MRRISRGRRELNFAPALANSSDRGALQLLERAMFEKPEVLRRDRIRRAIQNFSRLLADSREVIERVPASMRGHGGEYREA